MADQFLSVFFIGICNLGIEMAAGRILAPWFGSSLYQWAALISVALFSYSVGYSFHEKITNRRWLMYFCSLYTFAIPFWFNYVAGKITNFSFAPASILMSFLLISLPSICWAAVLPLVQKKADASLRGKVLMVSTLGNLAGVYLISFLMIPHFGLTSTWMFLGLLSSIGALVLYRDKAGLMVTVFLVLLSVIFIWRHQTDSSVVFNQESPYQKVSVVKNGDGLEFALDGNAQFAIFPGMVRDPKELSYFNFAIDTPKLVPAESSLELLNLGLGGGYVPHFWKKEFPNANITSVEIDPFVIQASQLVFPSLMQESAIQNMDARLFLQKSSKKYDVILVDAYFSSFIPYHLMSSEFFTLLQNHLNQGGLVVFNFLQSFKDSGLYDDLLFTLSKRFHFIRHAELAGINQMVVVSNTSLPEHPCHCWNEPTINTKASLITDDRNNTDTKLWITRRSLPMAEVL